MLYLKIIFENESKMPFRPLCNVQCADLHGLKTFAKITKNLVCEVTPSNVECTPCSLFCIHRFEPWRAPFVNNGPITDRAAAISLRQAKPPKALQC